MFSCSLGYQSDIQNILTKLQFCHFNLHDIINYSVHKGLMSDDTNIILLYSTVNKGLLYFIISVKIIIDVMVSVFARSFTLSS